MTFVYGIVMLACAKIIAMQKLIVFLSHIHEEAELAGLVKDLIETAFLSLTEVFVSSDPGSIPYGQKWLDEITTNLKACSVELILCSPESIKRPWINFEIGGGWVRGIPVIPLCHSGLERSKLPVPLSLLQAANTTDRQDMNHALATIATALGSSAPTVEIGPFITAVQAFEMNYTFWAKFDEALAFVQSIFRNDTEIKTAFASGAGIKTDITETGLNAVASGLRFLIDRGMLRIDRTGDTSMTTTGTYYGIRLTFSDDYRAALKKRP